ncbi:MAG: ATP-binding protein [Thermoguttaceae bacterium]|nr:ATP-binding protein [Thermoguttaceae bacterium]
MLLEFSCSNYKSIKDEILFSMIAGKDNAHEETLLDFDKYRILSNAVVYGANGSGKSAFIESIQFVKNLVVNSINHQPGQGILQIPHKTLGIDKDSSYHIQFTKEGVRYSFGFTLNQSLVSREHLYYFPKGRQVVIYERTSENYQPGNRYANKFDSCKDVLKPNRLFLSCAANFSSVPEIEKAYAFFRDDLVVYRGLGYDNWLFYSLNILENNREVKEAVLDVLGKLGTGIIDVDIKRSKTSFDQNALPPFLSDEYKAILLSGQKITFDVNVVYDKFSVDLTHESTGIKKLIEFICPLVDILSKGKVLVCDEMEAHFHESIMCEIVNLFRKARTPLFSQLVFTTHDTSLLDLNLFRRDQIWFTELTQDSRSTDLYSLAEIRNVRKDENIAKGYIAGKYGAIPMLNSELANFMTTEK